MPIFLLFLAATLAVFLSGNSSHATCGDLIVDVEAGEECDNDLRRFGGDGCASNCTLETKRDFLIDSRNSRSAVQTALFRVEFNLRGVVRVTAGKPDRNGLATYVFRERDVTIERVAVPGINCACVTSREDAEAFGPGNVGMGIIDCGDPPGSGGLEVPEVATLSRDHVSNDVDPYCVVGSREEPSGFHPGTCNGPIRFSQEGLGPRGSAVLFTNLYLRLINDGGTCSVDRTDPAKGADGIPCTEDDPTGEDDPAQRISVDLIAGMTGRVIASIEDANARAGATIGPGANCGALPCIVEESGLPFDCDRLFEDEPDAPIETGAVAVAFPVLDSRGVGDGIVTVRFVSRGRSPSCAGDCDGDQMVVISELIRGVNIALGSLPVEQCEAFDQDTNDQVTISELITGVRSALEGCPE